MDVATPPPPRRVPDAHTNIHTVSTALSLSLRPAFSATSITVLDKSPFPAPDGSSIDSSRVIRADYKDPLYSALAASAQVFWRGHDSPDSPFGGELGKHAYYSECGLILVGDGAEGGEYVTKSMANVKQAFGEKVQRLKDREAIRAACGTGGATGESGYINHASGWADAEAGMRFLRQKVEARKNVTFLTVEVEGLVYGEEAKEEEGGARVVGARLKGGDVLEAELTILATGSWTPGLVDLEGRAVATGQVMGYVLLTEEEESRYGSMPVILNFSSGLFTIPPRNGILKVARHAVGYVNHIEKVDPRSGKTIKVSSPKTALTHPGLAIPLEGEIELRHGLQEMVPEFGDRPFTSQRICWYTDTPTGDFIVTYHPTIKGLFLATGGSGHGYKFLPVLGEQVVDIVEGVPEAIFKELWRWREVVEGGVITSDGTRGGVVQIQLEEALKERSLKA